VIETFPVSFFLSLLFFLFHQPEFNRLSMNGRFTHLFVLWRTKLAYSHIYIQLHIACTFRTYMSAARAGIYIHTYMYVSLFPFPAYALFFFLYLHSLAAVVYFINTQ